jgi:hypothetical protein
MIGLRDPPDSRQKVGERHAEQTRLSLFYLGSYLVIIGFGLLFAPHGEPHPTREDRPSSDAPDRAPLNEVRRSYANFHLSGGKLDKAAPCRE